MVRSRTAGTGSVYVSGKEEADSASRKLPSSTSLPGVPEIENGGSRRWRDSFSSPSFTKQTQSEPM